MDHKYQYPFVGNSDHYDFLSHNASQCSHPVFEKGIANYRNPKKCLNHFRGPFLAFAINDYGEKCTL